ncbi:nickel/cobalt transporter [Halomonas sp. KG2]|uniref:nickel/cobalt transporter n=1 Tax=Halomonas sp. KG2 TaxID=2951138 RepID=UPI002648E8EF|nr:nickel/cobalt transporter [Halomonas sp. KG2]WKD27669.1 nickel/cobalt transporter [Halomonas sp. KG2]
MPLTRQQLLWGALTVSAALLLVFIVQANLQGVSLQLLAWQRDLHRTLTLAITELSRTPSSNTWLTLLGVSFAYGVFHAAGPGHGKAVLATYLASHGGATRRALGLSFAAALLQGITAIAMVAVLVHGLGWVTRQAMGSVVWVEQASFILVALLGGWLCWRAIKQLRHAYSGHASDAVGHSHSHSHDHSHCCGGAHHIEPQQALDWRTALMTVGAIGMRPCTGAVLMLGAASLLGQFYVGVASVLAMSLGTGITVSVLALASIVARGWAAKRLQQQSSRQVVEKAAGWAALAGGALIVVLGVSLSMAGAAQPASSPLLSEPPSRQGSLLGN